MDVQHAVFELRVGSAVTSQHSPRYKEMFYRINHYVFVVVGGGGGVLVLLLFDDDELMLNVLRCHLTY